MVEQSAQVEGRPAARKRRHFFGVGPCHIGAPGPQLSGPRIERGNPETWFVVDSSEASSYEDRRPEQRDGVDAVVRVGVPWQDVAGVGVQGCEVTPRSTAERREASPDVHDRAGRGDRVHVLATGTRMPRVDRAGVRINRSNALSLLAADAVESASNVERLSVKRQFLHDVIRIEAKPLVKPAIPSEMREVFASHTADMVEAPPKNQPPRPSDTTASTSPETASTIGRRLAVSLSITAKPPVCGPKRENAPWTYTVPFATARATTSPVGDSGGTLDARIAAAPPPPAMTSTPAATTTAMSTGAL